jgi:hypothetical protein
MPVVKKPKRAKKIKKPRGRRVATAPTRDVIINIQTSKPRARRQLVKKTAPKSEDLGGRIRDYETAQAQFRQTDLIRSQAKQIGLLDKRLSVLTDVIDNERNKPLVQNQPASIPKVEREVGAVMEGLLIGVELQAKTEEIEGTLPQPREGANRGRKPMTAEEKRNSRFARLNNDIREIKDTLTGGGGMTKRETKALNTRLRKAERERDEILAIQSQLVKK